MRSRIIFRAAILLPVACSALAVCVAAKAQVTQIVIQTQEEATNQIPGALPYRQQFDIDAAAGIKSISVTTPGNLTKDLTPDSGMTTVHWQYNSPAYASLSALHSVYDTGDYTFTILYNSLATDTVTLAFNPSLPGMFIQPTYPAINATNVPHDSPPPFTWALDTADSNGMLVMELHGPTGDSVAHAGPFPVTTLSWSPVSSLAPATQYDFQLGVYTGTAAVMSTDTVALHDSFQYYGVFGNVNHAPFTTTAAPEPSTLALLTAGAVGLLGCAWRRRTRVAG